MARQMVVSYGFSDIGPWTLQDQNAQSGDMIMRMMARNTISESLQSKIDAAVRTVTAAGPRFHLSARLSSRGGLALVPLLPTASGALRQLSWLCRSGKLPTSRMRWP